MGPSPSLVAAFLVVAACAPHVPPPAPEAEPQPTPVITAEPAPPSGPLETFTYAEELLQLDSRDPETPMRAVLVWARHHAVADTETRLAGLHRLQQFFTELEYMYIAMIDVDPTAMERIAALAPYGIEVREVDAKLVHIDSRLIERHASLMLLPQERRWLRAQAWDDDHTLRMGGDDPQDLVRSMLQWERVIDDGEPWASRGRQRIEDVLELYLELCFAVQMDEPTSCPVTPAMRRSYVSFVDEQRDSRLRGAVAEFLAAARRGRFDLPIDDTVELIGNAKAAITERRPAV